jgi:DNA repair protein RadC
MPSKPKYPVQGELLHSDRFAGLAHTDLNGCEQRSVIQLALAFLAARHRRGTMLANPKETIAYLQLLLAERKNEVFVALFLDNRHRLLCCDELFHGSVAGSAVHPRVVVQRALEINAAAVIFAHNHPSGVAEPSREDENITRRLKDALALVEVRVLDHVVVSAEGSVSLAERGLL